MSSQNLRSVEIQLTRRSWPAEIHIQNRAGAAGAVHQSNPGVREALEGRYRLREMFDGG